MCSSDLFACAWSPDGQRLASASDDKTVRLWEPESGREIRSLNAHTGWVRACAWSPDGQRLASASSDKTVRLWDPETGREIHRFDLPSTPQSVAFNPAGTLLAAALRNGTSILLKVPQGL